MSLGYIPDAPRADQDPAVRAREALIERLAEPNNLSIQDLLIIHRDLNPVTRDLRAKPMLEAVKTQITWHKRQAENDGNEDEALPYLEQLEDFVDGALTAINYS